MKYEPLRKYLYGLLAPVVAVLVGYGLVDEDKAGLWIALGTAVLAVIGTELARQSVTPVHRVEDLLGDQKDGAKP